MENEIILFDLATKDGTCYSPNAWKARAALNLKGIPYKTQWIEYRNLASDFKCRGIPPNDPAVCQFEYSIPAIQLPDGSYMMESHRIAERLEQMFPKPSLQLTSDHATRAQAAVDQLARAIVPGIMYRIPDTLMNAEDASHYRSERARQVSASMKKDGMTLYDLAKSPMFSGEAAWENAKPGLQSVRDLLLEDPSGPYIMGKQGSFADIVIVSLWRFLAQLDDGGDVYGRVMKFDAAFDVHEKACQKWFQRSDH